MNRPATFLDWDLIQRLREMGIPPEELTGLAKEGVLDAGEARPDEVSLHADPDLPEEERATLSEAIEFHLERYKRRRFSVLMELRKNLTKTERVILNDRKRKIRKSIEAELRRLGCKPACIKRKIEDANETVRELAKRATAPKT